MGDPAFGVEMSEPGAAGGPFPQIPAADAAAMIVEGSPRLSREITPGRRIGPYWFSLGPAFGDGSVRILRRPALSADGKLGDSPANSRRRLRTCPKLRPGSSFCTRQKTSPLASLVGSHQPRPAWLTIRISPLSRRYFRLSFVLSFRSSFQQRRRSLQHHGAMHLAPQFLDFGVVSSHLRSSRFKRRSWAAWPFRWSSPLPFPADRETVGLQGRAERAGASDAPLWRGRR